MAKLSPGITFATNDYVTIAKLYALIDTAVAAADAYPGSPTLFDVVMSDLDTVRAIGTVAAPSSPATNDLTVGTDGMLDRYDGAAWVDLAVDFIYLINSGSFTLVTGTPVVIDTSASGKCMLWGTAGVCYEPFGISAGVFAPNATAQIRTQGICPVSVPSSLTLSLGSKLRIAALGATNLSSTGTETSDVLATIVKIDFSELRTVLAALVH